MELARHWMVEEESNAAEYRVGGTDNTGWDWVVESRDLEANRKAEENEGQGQVIWVEGIKGDDMG